MSATAQQVSDSAASLRRIMVDRQVRTFDVTDPGVIQRMIDVPRELFLPANLAALAYSDASLFAGQADGEARKLLTPMVLARLIQAAQVRPSDRALEIAGGGGYGAAILAGLCSTVISVDTAPQFAERASAGFQQIGAKNASAATGRLVDGAGHPGPFDIILINGALEVEPEALLNLLAEGGRLVAIEQIRDQGPGASGMASVWTKTSGSIGKLRRFNASAQTLNAFREIPRFTF